MSVNKGKIYCLKNSLNFIEFFKSMNFTELLVNVTEFFNLAYKNRVQCMRAFACASCMYILGYGHTHTTQSNSKKIMHPLTHIHTYAPALQSLISSSKPQLGAPTQNNRCSETPYTTSLQFTSIYFCSTNWMYLIDTSKAPEVEAIVVWGVVLGVVGGRQSGHFVAVDRVEEKEIFHLRVSHGANYKR